MLKLSAERAGYINDTSTGDFGLGAGFAFESVPTLTFARSKITQTQRLDL